MHFIRKKNMNPLKLKLTGFAGISSGRGKNSIELDLTIIPSDAELIAITGPNGAGKTTVMDNLHPYRVMPSRLDTTTSAPNPNSFSYYDHISDSSAEKELFWEHQGNFYKSLVQISAMGKTKKQEAFLFIQQNGEYVPYVSKLGVASDGKAAVYDACVVEIMGEPEVFFTAAFSAQGKRSLSALKAPEIKELLTSMLRLDDIKALSEKAAEIVKAMRPHLEVLKQQALPAQQKVALEASLVSKMASIELELVGLSESQKLAQTALMSATESLGRTNGAVDQQQSLVAQRESLVERITASTNAATFFISDLKLKQANEANSLSVRLFEISSSGNTALAAMNDLKSQLADANEQSMKIDVLTALSSKADGLLQQMSDIRVQIEDLEIKVKPLSKIREDAQQFSESMAGLTSDGKSLAAAIEVAKATAALIGQVPCQGTDMQSGCSLLANANKAADGLPRQEAAKQVLLTRHADAKAGVLRTRNQLVDLVDAEELLKEKNKQLVEITQKRNDAKNAATLLPNCLKAQAKIPDLTERLQAEQLRINQLRETKANVETELGNVKRVHEAAVATETENSQKNIRDLETALALLPKVVGIEDVQSARDAVAHAQAVVDGLQESVMRVMQEKSNTSAALKEVAIAKDFIGSVDADALRISDEMSRWSLLSKAFGNDGVIALSIDDAGPEISRIANKLLDDCYGGRFQVRMDTQKTSATGTLKETFEIIVEDSERGEEKSISLMSGGEKVWVNECIVRAFALYMTQSSGAHYDTLFCDESDGALDPERKRQFMAMKRAVLKSGGYKREFLITQTPELWGMADYVIDVSKL
jgi:DNA repair protein SbcC/Rad50